MAKVVLKDAGDYKVTLENDSGQAAWTVKLIVLGMLSRLSKIKLYFFTYFLVICFYLVIEVLAAKPHFVTGTCHYTEVPVWQFTPEFFFFHGDLSYQI